MQKLLDTLCILVVIAAGGVYLFNQFAQTSVIGNVTNQPVFFTATNGTSSISRVSPVTVFSSDSYSLFARIDNPTVNNISCKLETATAASSTLTSGVGLQIGSASTTALKPSASMCFGAVPGCIPYVGKVNCIADVTSTVNITYK